jgi:Carboxypeptidase regulatory-like domain
MKYSHPTLRSFLSLLAASLFITAARFIEIAFAKSATATLSGTVVEQGAVVPGATVTAPDATKAVRWQVTTNNDGYFTVSQLPPSRHAVDEASRGPDTNDR